MWNWNFTQTIYIKRIFARWGLWPKEDSIGQILLHLLCYHHNQLSFMHLCPRLHKVLYHIIHTPPPPLPQERRNPIKSCQYLMVPLGYRVGRNYIKEHAFNFIMRLSSNKDQGVKCIISVLLNETSILWSACSDEITNREIDLCH